MKKSLFDISFYKSITKKDDACIIKISIENFEKKGKLKLSKKNSENKFSDSFKFFELEDFAKIFSGIKIPLFKSRRFEVFQNCIYARSSIDHNNLKFIFIYISLKLLLLNHFLKRIYCGFNEATLKKQLQRNCPLLKGSGLSFCSAL